MNDDLSPAAKAVATIGALAAVVLSVIWTWTAFAGGTFWPTSWETEGSIGFGLTWLLVLDPLAITVVYWVTMAVAIPIMAIDEAAKKRTGRDDIARADAPPRPIATTSATSLFDADDMDLDTEYLFEVEDGDVARVVLAGETKYDGPVRIDEYADYLGPEADDDAVMAATDLYVIAPLAANHGNRVWVVTDSDDIDAEVRRVGDVWVITAEREERLPRLPTTAIDASTLIDVDRGDLARVMVGGSPVYVGPVRVDLYVDHLDEESVDGMDGDAYGAALDLAAVVPQGVADRRMWVLADDAEVEHDGRYWVIRADREERSAVEPDQNEDNEGDL
jgi:hypothetical protein